MSLRSFLGGFGIGAGLALLLAPKTGQEVRDMISDKVEQGQEYISEFGENINDAVEQGKKIVGRQSKAVRDAAQAASDTYRREAS